MRRATGISVSLHGAALVALVAAAVSSPPPPVAAPKPMAVTLAPLPARKPAPPQPAAKPPEPAPKPPQPQTPPKRPTPPTKPVRPLAAASAPVLAAAPAEAAPASPAPAAPSAPAPLAPPAQATGPDASWLGAVRARMEAAKRYPPAAVRRGEQGVASIRLEIAPDGRILSVALVTGSGSRLLDREALDLPERISSLPPMPDSMGTGPITLVVPVSFTLR